MRQLGLFLAAVILLLLVAPRVPLWQQRQHPCSRSWPGTSPPMVPSMCWTPHSVSTNWILPHSPPCVSRPAWCRLSRSSSAQLVATSDTDLRRQLPTRRHPGAGPRQPRTGFCAPARCRRPGSRARRRRGTPVHHSHGDAGAARWSCVALRSSPCRLPICRRSPNPLASPLRNHSQASSILPSIPTSSCCTSATPIRAARLTVTTTPTGPTICRVEARSICPSNTSPASVALRPAVAEVDISAISYDWLGFEPTQHRIYLVTRDDDTDAAAQPLEGISGPPALDPAGDWLYVVRPRGLWVLRARR